MAEGVVVQNQTGVIIECNPAACAILGLTHDQLLGRPALGPETAASARMARRCLAPSNPICCACAAAWRSAMSSWAFPLGEQRQRLATDPLDLRQLHAAAGRHSHVRPTPRGHAWSRRSPTSPAIARPWKNCSAPNGWNSSAGSPAAPYTISTILLTVMIGLAGVVQTALPERPSRPARPGAPGRSRRAGVASGRATVGVQQAKKIGRSWRRSQHHRRPFPETDQRLAAAARFMSSTPEGDVLWSTATKRSSSKS